MSIVKEFQEFALKGNVVDMAVGIIIGAEFGKIVNSMVADIIMPPIGLLIGGVDFKTWAIPLSEKSVLGIGNFITTVINFVIIALAIFLMIKAMNKVRVNKPQPPPAA